MKLTIPCATFNRLVPVALQPGENAPHGRPYFACVRIENRRGSRFAMASNGEIFVLERLAATDDPDAAVNIPLKPELLAACQKEARLASTLTVENMVAKTSFGFQAFLTMSAEYVDWSRHIPTKIAQVANAAILIDKESVRLINSAPSGRVVTQKFFDRKKPAIFRDPHSPDWFGMWLDIATEVETPAELPEWL